MAEGVANVRDRSASGKAPYAGGKPAPMGPLPSIQIRPTNGTNYGTQSDHKLHTLGQCLDSIPHRCSRREWDDMNVVLIEFEGVED